MTLQVGLNIVTLIMCILTLAMASAALLPQIKLALAMLRDSLLWLILISVIGVVGTIGWGRFLQVRRERAESEAVPSVISVPPTKIQAEPKTPSPQPDSSTDSRTLAVNGRSSGRPFAPNRSWPRNSRDSADAR